MNARIWPALAAEFLFFAALLFGAAGTLAWPAAWLYLAVFFGGASWITMALARRDPALLAERMKWPVQRAQPLWDRLVMVSLMIGWCGWLVLMGLDAVRLHWSHMPAWLQGVGAVAMVLSWWMVARVFRENTFLAPVVRIQSERGHRVISSGPYAVVRHPLYAAMLVFLPANALLLGSWAGVAASSLLLGALVFRTAMEDRELHRSLPGYAHYAARVRYRLIPRVW